MEKKIYNIALVAHDNRKVDLAEWVAYNKEKLKAHRLICTGTTGKMIEKVIRLKSGPLGGDQQLGALISEGKIDIMFFFWDPMSQQPHDVDVKALLRIGVLYNIPMASCRSTADYIISSPLFGDAEYEAKKYDYQDYIGRKI